MCSDISVNVSNFISIANFITYLFTSVIEEFLNYPFNTTHLRDLGTICIVYLRNVQKFFSLLYISCYHAKIRTPSSYGFIINSKGVNDCFYLTEICDVEYTK